MVLQGASTPSGARLPNLSIFPVSWDFYQTWLSVFLAEIKFLVLLVYDCPSSLVYEFCDLPCSIRDHTMILLKNCIFHSHYSRTRSFLTLSDLDTLANLPQKSISVANIFLFCCLLICHTSLSFL